MSEFYYRFFNWSRCTSKDEKNPDILNCTILEEDTFETEYGTCVVVKIDNEIWAITLYNFGSANRSLITQWAEAKKKGKIKRDRKFKLITWMGISKRNKDREIRRSKLVF